MKVIESHEFTKIANAGIMDSEDEIKLSVNKGKHLEYDLVENRFTKYDSIINLAHGKCHMLSRFRAWKY